VGREAIPDREQLRRRARRASRAVGTGRQEVTDSEWSVHGQALAHMDRAHRHEHRQLARRQRQIAGAASGLSRHDGVASVYIDAGLTHPRRARLKVDI
jgi:hypothetical protein